MKTISVITATCWFLAALTLPVSGQNAITRSLFDPDLYAPLNNGNSLVLNAGDTLAIDTTALTITRNGVSLGSGIVGNTVGPNPQPVALFTFTSLTIPAGVTVNIAGNRPLGLLARRDMKIGTSLNLSGASGAGRVLSNSSIAGATGRLGGFSGGSSGGSSGTNGLGPGAGRGGVGEHSGGGGAGHALLGGTGQGAAGGGGGSTYSTFSVSDLYGGSGGGGGGGDYITWGTNETGGSGGAGGGALVLVAQQELHFFSTAVVSVRGGDGGLGSGQDANGGGGGGSGGTIVCAAPSIINSSGAVLRADGGSGGSANYASYVGNSGYPYYYPYYNYYYYSGGNGGGGRVAFYSTGMTGSGSVYTGTSYTSTANEPSFVFPAALRAPIASFSASPNAVAPNQTVTFNAGASSPAETIVNYSWNWGDGSPAVSGATATHSFPLFGSYLVTLTVTDSQGYTATSTTTVNVNLGNQAPLANAGGVYEINIGDPLVLNGAGSTDANIAAGDSITNYQWFIEGTLVATGVSPTVPWATLQSLLVSPADYPTDPITGLPNNSVSLQVTDSFGASSTATATLRTYQNQILPSLAVEPNLPAQNQLVMFVANATYHGDPRRAVVSYTWNFGDGSNYTETAADAPDGSFDGLTTHAFVNAGTYAVSMTAMDDSVPSKTAVAIASVTVRDTTAPLVDAHANVTVPATSAAGALVTYAAATATDVVGVISLTYSQDSGTTFPIGTTTVTISATDAAGNTGIGTFTVTVTNNAPVVTLTGATPLTFEAAASYSDPGATADDVEDGTLTSVLSSNSVVANLPGTYAVTWSVTDSAGVSGSATRTVNVVDTTAPVVDPHANVTVAATSAAGAVVTYAPATATDAVGVISLTYSQDSGTVFPLGNTTVTISATDAAGNTGIGTFTVTVTNNAPVVTLTGANPLTFEAAASYSDPGGTADDVEDGTLLPVISSNSVVANLPGTYAVTWSVTDSANVSGSATRTVNVVDTTAPVVDPHANVSVPATSAAGAVVTYAPATATDAVGVISLTYSQDSGTTFPIGTTTVVITAKDAAGNTGTGSFTVTVADTTAPVVDAHANVTVEATSAAGAVVTYAAATATDAVGVTSLTYSQDSGTTFPLGTTTVTITANDAAANTGTGSFTVTVADTTAPVVDAHANVTVEATSAAGAVVTYAAATATDAVGVTSLTYSQDSGTVFPLGTTTVTITAKDAAGNMGTGSFDVTVQDTIPPGISSVTSAGLYAVGASAALSASFSDEVGVESISFHWDDSSPSTVINDPASPANATHVYTAAGVYQPTVTVVDGSGNSVSQAYQYIVIYDPSAGFVTGGGWIHSPAGAYVPNPTLTGKAHFGFTSKYKRGMTVPTGETAFQFQAGSLKFSSTSYEWLVVSGPKGQYKGSGTINGTGHYGFLLTATDGQSAGGGGIDKFRIKIWDMNDGDSVVYDNTAGSDDISGSPTQAIAGGSIVIHNK